MSDTDLRTTAHTALMAMTTCPLCGKVILSISMFRDSGSRHSNSCPRTIGYDPSNPGSRFLTSVFQYRPQFIPIDGSKSKLEIDPSVGQVTLKKDGDEFFWESSGFGELGFNPKRSQLGGKYILTLENGTKYTIDANSGAILSMVDSNDVTTNYDNGNATSSSSHLVIHRFGDGRIDWIAQQIVQQTSTILQHKVTYQYDESKGDLISVTDELGNVTKFTYDANRPHYLTKVTDARNVDVATASYDDSGKLIALTNAMNKTAPMQYNGFDGTTGSTSTTDLTGNSTEEIYDNHGNVIREIKAIKDSAGEVVKYMVTVHEFLYVDPSDSNLQDHVQNSWLYGASNLNKLAIANDYQSFEILGPDNNGDRYTKPPTTLSHSVQYMLLQFDGSNKDDKGLFLPQSETPFLADGTSHNRSFSDYDSFGHPQRTVETFSQNGHTVTYVTLSIYDDKGNLKYSFKPFSPGDTFAEGTEFLVNARGQVTQTWRVKCPNPTDARACVEPDH